MKRVMTLLAAAVLALDAAAIVFDRQHERITVTLPSIDASQQAAEEIITGVCDFGGCPAGNNAEFGIRNSELTEPEEAPEPVEFSPEAPEEPVWQGGRTVTCWVTAYCGCESCSEGWGTMTATGVTARPGHTVAVDPSVIPFGTRLEINGNVYTAEDCGGGVNGYSVDVYFASHWQCEAWPTGYYSITIL